jgi:hypothetical protein
VAAAGCWLLAAGCLLLRSNFDRTTTTHKLQVNKHTTMKIEVIVSHFWSYCQKGGAGGIPNNQNLIIIPIIEMI